MAYWLILGPSWCAAMVCWCAGWICSPRGALADFAGIMVLLHDMQVAHAHGNMHRGRWLSSQRGFTAGKFSVSKVMTQTFALPCVSCPCPPSNAAPAPLPFLLLQPRLQPK